MRTQEQPTVASLVREWRTKRGLTQQQLAHSLVITSSYISQIETGKKLPADHTIKAIIVQLALTEEASKQLQKALAIEQIRIKERRMKKRLDLMEQMRTKIASDAGGASNPDIEELCVFLRQGSPEARIAQIVVRELMALARSR